MTSTKQAIPTDFMGVRFRSKSEAMFANVLEHLGLVWVYEPAFLVVGDYSPDFICFTKEFGCLARAHVIEYKPSKPTPAYFERLADKAPLIRRKFGQIQCGIEVNSINFFEDAQLDVWEYVSKQWIKRPVQLPDAILDSVMSYRYDLESTVTNAPQPPQQEAAYSVKNKTVEPTTPLMQFREAVGSLDGMLADFARLAHAVEVNGDEWNVIFPPGITRPKDLCERIENTFRIKDAIFRTVGHSVKLKFSVMQSRLNKKFFEGENEK